MYARGYNAINSCHRGFGFMNSGIGMFVAFLLVLIVAIIVILLLTRSKRYHSSEYAMEELKLRFVKGEVSEEEYLKTKKLIDMK